MLVRSRKKTSLYFFRNTPSSTTNYMWGGCEKSRRTSYQQFTNHNNIYVLENIENLSMGRPFDRYWSHEWNEFFDSAPGTYSSEETTNSKSPNSNFSSTKFAVCFYLLKRNFCLRVKIHRQTVNFLPKMPIFSFLKINIIILETNKYS